jgi:hypothetical protein
VHVGGSDRLDRLAFRLDDEPVAAGGGQGNIGDVQPRRLADDVLAAGPDRLEPRRRSPRHAAPLAPDVDGGGRRRHEGAVVPDDEKADTVPPGDVIGGREDERDVGPAGCE